MEELRSGRNAVDPPHLLKPSECQDAVNIEWYHSSLGRKRQGSQLVTVTGFTGAISSLFRFVPGTDETVAELWGADDAQVVQRLPGAQGVWSAPTLKDTPSGHGYDFDWAALNGTLFIAYASGSGFSTPGAPTVANTGSGSYAAVGRYYRLRWTTQVAGITTRRSPVGTAASIFTPSGSGAGALVTRSSPPGVGETHWELEVSYDNTTWRVLYGDGGLFAAIVIGTTTATDSSVAAATTIVQVFTTSGTWTRPSFVSTVTYGIVGGGGGGAGTGGGGRVPGGGGGGEWKSASVGVSNPTYAFTIGAGGAAGGFSTSGSNGGDTVFDGVTAKGGGGGGFNANGNAGGSGGGGSAYPGGTFTGGAATGGGGAGGNGATDGSDWGAGGGGGSAGAGGNGSTANFGTGGNGGPGTVSSLSGSSATYGAGGAGNGIGQDGVDGPVGYGKGGIYSVAGTGGVLILSYAGLSVANASLSLPDATNRLHLWDGTTVRRAGLATPNAAPTAANAGSGSYAATLRYYRVRWTTQTGGVTIRRSEPGPSLSFTPSGSGASVTVTQPATLAGEGETHWEVEGSTDNVTFYVLSAIPVATTTYSDSTAPASYTTGANLSQLTGTYTTQRAYRFIAADSGRLLGFGSWSSGDRQNDIEISAVTGSLNIGDGERVDTTQTYRYTLDENDSGAPTGLRGPVFGNFYAFKSTQLWELVPTGLTNNPYRRNPISKVIGCVGRGASCIGEDASGNQALYFMSRRGMYTYGVSGLQYIGKGIEDLVLGPTATINLSAAHAIAWMVYYPFKRQVWVGWATGNSNDPNVCAVYDVTTGGWSSWTGIPAAARCATLFANTIGASSVSVDLKPYLGMATGTALYKGDADNTSDDNGVLYQAYVLTPPITPGELGYYRGRVGDAVLFAQALSGVTITTVTVPDFGADSGRFGTADLTRTGLESHVTRRVEGSAHGDVAYVHYQLGDAAPISNGCWSLERLLVPCESFEGTGD